MMTLGVLVIGLFACGFVDRPSFPIELRHYDDERFKRVSSLYFTRCAMEFLFIVAFSVASFVGLFFFWRFARLIFCGAILLTILAGTDPVHGPDVIGRWEGLCESIFNLLIGIILVAVFMSPIKELFVGGKEADANRLGACSPRDEA
jgi:hypothetical protein